MCVYSRWEEINLFIVGTCLPFGDKIQVSIMKSLYFKVKTWFKVKVRVRVSLQGINVSQCNVL